MSDYLEFDPSSIDRRVVYRLLTGSLVPRPIGWASTVSAAGVANLAPFSFFTVVCIIPPMVSLTIARNPAGNEKHTLKHIRQSGEFCINVVTQPVWTEMVDTANAVHERDSAANRAAIVKLVQTADLLFIEAAFAEAATERAHLTTTATGRIACEAAISLTAQWHRIVEQRRPRYRGRYGLSSAMRASLGIAVAKGSDLRPAPLPCVHGESLGPSGALFASHAPDSVTALGHANSSLPV
jgi:flavin reductase (DIM6/NTAB) family NADH-FMN oxidoreductase RutF